MLERTLPDFADHGALVAKLIADATLVRFAAGGVDVRARPNTLLMSCSVAGRRRSLNLSDV
jgi:hypothetical protein